MAAETVPTVAEVTVRITGTETIASPKTGTNYLIEVAEHTKIWTIKLRYSELLTLHNALSELGAPLPPFPPKKTFGNMAAEFIEGRRVALEVYLQQASRSDKIRGSPVFRKTLQLDEKSEGVEVRSNDIEKWMTTWEELDSLCQSISDDLLKRKRIAQSETGDTDVSKITQSIRAKLSTLSAGLSSLGETLDGLPVTDREKARRFDMMMSLHGRKDGLVEALRAPIPKKTDAASPSSETAATRRRQGWGVPETEVTKDLTNAELNKLAEKIMEDQDEGLDQLSKILSRQINMASTINAELDLQNNLLDDLNKATDRTSGKIHKENGQVMRLL